MGWGAFPPLLGVLLLGTLTIALVRTGADPASLIRGGPYSEFSFQILGNYSKEASFLQFEKFLSF